MAEFLITSHCGIHEDDTDISVEVARSRKMHMKYRMVISIVILQTVEQNSLNEINYERNTCNRKFKHRYGD
jgi:hypothetical protein